MHRARKCYISKENHDIFKSRRGVSFLVLVTVCSTSWLGAISPNPFTHMGVPVSPVRRAFAVLAALYTTSLHPPPSPDSYAIGSFYSLPLFSITRYQKASEGPN